MTSPIERFFECRRIALIGLSRDPASFSRSVCRELVARGFDVVPVHPEASEIEGRACARRVQQIQPPVEAALVMTPADRSEAAVIDCAAAGVGLVWLHRGAGPGAASPGAVAACRRAGIEVVPGACPLMHLPGTGLVHRLHRGIARLLSRVA